MTATMARKKPNDALPDPSGRQGKSMQMYIPPDLADAFDAYVESSRPRTTKTAIVVMLLEDFLKKTGHWPPAGE